MKKQGLLAGLLMGGMLLVGSGAWAIEDSVRCGMAEKGTHGLVDIATGWMEVPMQIYKGYDEGIKQIKAPAASRSVGTLVGAFRGAFHATGRTCWGVMQLAGFWTLNHTDNSHLLQLHDSEYAFEMGQKKRIRCPNVDAGLTRIGERFERGCLNLLGAPAEIPGQIRRSDGERCVYVGLPKGVWFMASRAMYGVGDIGLVAVPSPNADLGVAFDEVQAWDAVCGRYYTNVK